MATKSEKITNARIDFIADVRETINCATDDPDYPTIDFDVAVDAIAEDLANFDETINLILEGEI